MSIVVSRKSVCCIWGEGRGESTARAFAPKSCHQGRSNTVATWIGDRFMLAFVHWLGNYFPGVKILCRLCPTKILTEVLPCVYTLKEITYMCWRSVVPVRFQWIIETLKKKKKKFVKACSVGWAAQLLQLNSATAAAGFPQGRWPKFSMGEIPVRQ